MPIYEYQCGQCEHKLEAIQKVSDAPLTDCPECGESALRKLISAAGFRLKGGGWYETDFKSSNKRNLANESGGSDAKSGGDSKSESKTESKQESTKASGDSGKAKAASDA